MPTRQHVPQAADDLLVAMEITERHGSKLPCLA
jgi:hypothetical protein